MLLSSYSRLKCSHQTGSMRLWLLHCLRGVAGLRRSLLRWINSLSMIWSSEREVEWSLEIFRNKRIWPILLDRFNSKSRGTRQLWNSLRGSSSVRDCWMIRWGPLLRWIGLAFAFTKWASLTKVSWSIKSIWLALTKITRLLLFTILGSATERLNGLNRRILSSSVLWTGPSAERSQKQSA